MPFDFTNKRVVVTGGSRGIGRAIALAFAAAGADVSICARSADALAHTKGEITAKGRRSHAGTCARGRYRRWEARFRAAVCGPRHNTR